MEQEVAMSEKLRFNKDGQLDTRGKRQLKPCPFCGGKATLCKNMQNKRRDSYYVQCDKCLTSMAVSYYEKTVIKAWNKRSK